MMKDIGEIMERVKSNSSPPRKRRKVNDAPKLFVAPWAMLLAHIIPVFNRNHPKIIDNKMVFIGKVMRPRNTLL